MTVPAFQPTIDYTSRDYDALRADMIRLVRARIPQWNADTADFGMALIEAFAYSADIINYYLDRVANESYLSTAVQRESLYSIAAMFNYQPRQAESATVVLQFANSTSTEMVVPVGTRCQATIITTAGTALRNYETLAEIRVPALVGMDPGIISIDAQEGRTYRDETIGVSNGFVRQRYLLPRTQVLTRSITVTTQLGDSVLPWTPTTSLATAAPKDQVFQVTTQTDGSSLIEFGNGTNGAIPPLFAVIRATYRVGGGTGGNVSVGTINTIVEPVLYGASVINPVAASGGIDAESIDSIRINAARAFRARDRAVTVPDYEAVALTYAYVSKAKALGNNASSVTVYAAPNDDGTGKPELSADMASLIRAYIQQRAMAGVTVVVVGVAWTDVWIRIETHNDPTVLQSAVETEIKSRLAEFYSFTNVDFDGWVSAADILSVLQGVDGVQYIEVLGLGKGPDKEYIVDPDLTAFDENGAPALDTNGNMLFPTTTVVMVNQEVQHFDPDVHVLVKQIGGIGSS